MENHINFICLALYLFFNSAIASEDPSIDKLIGTDKVLSGSDLIFIGKIESEEGLESTDVSSPNSQEQNTQTIGEEPLEDISKLFLRESEVLLKPMEVQLSTGINYSKNDRYENLRLIRVRDVSMPINISVGLTQRFEVFAAIPVLYTQREFVAFNDSIKYDDNGVGDLSLGFSIKLRDETQSIPSITGSFNQSMPTGDEAKLDDPESIDFTSGFWSHNARLSMTKSVDPAVLFFNLGYTRTYAKDEFGDTVKPGDAVGYGFGTGFSINSAISLSGRFFGNYVKEYRVNEDKIIGSGSEAVSFNLSLTYQLSNTLRFETGIDFGLNDDANDSAIEFSYIYSLNKNR